MVTGQLSVLLVFFTKETNRWRHGQHPKKSYFSPACACVNKNSPIQFKNIIFIFATISKFHKTYFLYILFTLRSSGASTPFIICKIII
jgi:hypothetical protein